MRLRSVSRPVLRVVVAYMPRFAHVSWPFHIRTYTHAHAPQLHTTATHFIIFSADLGQVKNNSVTWNVSLPAYWTVQISIEDANLNEGWSQPVRVLHHMPLPAAFLPSVFKATS